MGSVTALKKKKPTLQKKVREGSFPVVAIGASAGGLEAISALLKNLPSDTGMAFIYVQHLSPDHKSFLTSILSKLTKMKVQEIVNMEQIAPNNVYVIPPNKGIEVTDGHIQLLPHTSSLSIDVLFSSLAETHKKNVIGIILSGYARDGIIGLKAIKDAGGMTFAQDDSAQASSMPKSAIGSGAVDFILSPEEIAFYLAKYSKNGFVRSPIKVKKKEDAIEYNNSDLNSIFELLHKETGIDFSHYKMPTIKRRLNHKMLQSGVKTIKEYVKLLLKNNNEIEVLHRDLLINVTSFFRDSEVFKYLKATLLPKILNNKTTGETLRIWVPACSSGQEVYSIAMMITELQDKKRKKIPVKIFATDVSDPIIREARIGEYSENEIKAVSKKYRERFFIKTGENYQVIKELREMCVFSPHNILRDPPFSRMDFISCRNLLIYFDAAAQKKVFATLHFALKDGGYLMLGKAETIGTSSQLFNRINNKFKIYSRKKDTGARKIPELTPHFPHKNLQNKKTGSPAKNINTNLAGIEQSIDSILLSNYIPACVVVNKEMEILQSRGPISLFLKLPSWKASLNVLKMTRPEFAFDLRNSIHKAIKTKKLIQKSGIEIKIESVIRMMSIEVRPLKIEWDEPLLLIVFTLQEKVEKITGSDKSKKNNSSLKLRIKNLEEELSNTRSEMNSIIESQEATCEELQTANEESVSSNEEFQTLNEELETSKEEIEATNEELISTNQELQVRNDLLTESQEYSEAIISTIHEPMLILHKNFRVKSANGSFYKKFLVKKEDTEGALLFELGNNQWNIPKLKEVLNNIISKNSSFENFEVTHAFPEIGEKIMLLNAHLIIQKTHREQLILLAVSDITETRRLAIELQTRESAEELRIANKELAAQNIEKEKREQELIIANKELVFQNKEKEKRAAELIIANKELALQNEEKEKREVANKKLQEFSHTAKLASQYSLSLIEASHDPLVTISKEGKIMDMNEATVKITGLTREKMIGSDFFGYFTEPQTAREVYQKVFAKGSVADSPLTLRNKDGKLTDVLFNGSVYKDDKGNVLGAVVVARDITDQKRIATELKEAKEDAELAKEIAEKAKDKAESATQIAEDAVKAKQQFLSNMSHEIRTPMNAIIGFTKVVLKTDLSEKQKEYLTAIKTGGDSLIVLINDILDLAKVDAGKMSFEKTPFKMETSISSMLHLFETKIQEKNLEYVKEYDKKIPEVLVGDPVRLHQIILNLVSNAVKFTPKGRITVSIRLLKEDEEKVSVEFAVTDTGIGIPQNEIENIFESFQQASIGTSRLYGGTGLGLAIVKQLVELQGGSISVRSRIDRGSTFSFILNFQKPKDVTELETGIVELNSEIKNIKVLVVEDIALNQLLMKTLLDDFGVESDMAENGKIAIEKLKTKTYDIILMDLQMPEMSGFEATEYIRTKMNSKIPILALTADVTTVDLEKCRAIGMNDYIAKPVDEKLLYSKILGLVKKPFLHDKKENEIIK